MKSSSNADMGYFHSSVNAIQYPNTFDAYIYFLLIEQVLPKICENIWVIFSVIRLGSRFELKNVICSSERHNQWRKFIFQVGEEAIPTKTRKCSLANDIIYVQIACLN